MQLAPCPACRRHAAGSGCPFCGAPLTPQATTGAALGRMSRAMVMGAALVGAGCGGKSKPPEDQTTLPESEYHMDHPCVDPDPAKIDALEKKKEAAQTDEEKAQIEQDLARARHPVCAPYGAPPARRRVV